MEWDDSAAREAFDNAKARFLAEINGLRCDISLPDPNLFIDKVDYNAHINPELVADLEKEVPSFMFDCKDEISASKSVKTPISASKRDSGEAQGEHISSWDVQLDRLIIPTGWGDLEDQAATDSLDAWSKGPWELNGSNSNTRKTSAGWGDGNWQAESWNTPKVDLWRSGRDNSWNNSKISTWTDGRDNKVWNGGSNNF